jgi:hypothetical protein
MPLRRHHDWRSRLGRILESACELQFEWGRFDCALHVCNCIRAIVDVDPAKTLRGTYSDEAGAAAVYGASFETFIANQAATLGCEEVPVTLARRGDVVFIDNDTPQGCVGVVSLDARLVSCVGEKGVVHVPMIVGKKRRWKRAWRIG